MLWWQVHIDNTPLEFELGLENECIQWQQPPQIYDNDFPKYHQNFKIMTKRDYYKIQLLTCFSVNTVKTREYMSDWSTNTEDWGKQPSRIPDPPMDPACIAYIVPRICIFHD